MPDTACDKADLVAAYQDMIDSMQERRQRLWNAYRSATDSMGRNDYADLEPEAWSILQAGIAGIDAEERSLTREYERRADLFDAPEGTSRRVS